MLTFFFGLFSLSKFVFYNLPFVKDVITRNPDIFQVEEGSWFLEYYFGCLICVPMLLEHEGKIADKLNFRIWSRIILIAPILVMIFAFSIEYFREGVSTAYLVSIPHVFFFVYSVVIPLIFMIKFASYPHPRYIFLFMAIFFALFVWLLWAFIDYPFFFETLRLIPYFLMSLYLDKQKHNLSSN